MAAPAAPAPAPEQQFELEDDYVTVPGQVYALVSFVAPTGTNQRNDKFGLKLRGCFATQDEAKSHVKRLQKTDPIMDIYLVDMYKWLLIPPDPNAVESQEYQEEFLNELVKGWKDSQAAAKEHFQERKAAVQRDGLIPHLLPHERLPPPGPDVDVRSMFEEVDPHAVRRGDGAGPSTQP
jgi:hypothetical protein